MGRWVSASLLNSFRQMSLSPADVSRRTISSPLWKIDACVTLPGRVLRMLVYCPPAKSLSLHMAGQIIQQGHFESSFCFSFVLELLFDLFGENVSAFVPVEPSDGASSMSAARGWELMLHSQSHSRTPCLDSQNELLTHCLLPLLLLFFISVALWKNS